MSKTTMTVAAALLALGGPALAQEDGDRAGDNLQGFYLGGGIGDFSAAIDDIENLGDVDDVGIDFSDGDNAMKVFAGYAFNRFFAVQADFVDFGESSGVDTPSRTGTSDVQGLAPSVVGTLPIGPIELFARVGYIFYEVDLNLSGRPLDRRERRRSRLCRRHRLRRARPFELAARVRRDRYRRARRSRRAVAQRRLEVLAHILEK